MNQLNVNLPELPYAVSEAMNRLRINIKFCGKNTRKILLTSCQPNEGKSTISSYLWKMLAEAGFPTVLVDVDLRKSVMKTRFQMDYDDDTSLLFLLYPFHLPVVVAAWIAVPARRLTASPFYCSPP